MKNSGLGTITLAMAALVFFPAGCSDDNVTPADFGVEGGISEFRLDAPPSDLVCKLKITKINGSSASSFKKLLTTDDLDLPTMGTQIDLEVEGNIPDNTSVGLSVTDLSPDPKVKISGGKASFSKVTVSANLTTVVINAYAPGCKSDTLTLPVDPVPGCTFEDPKTGVTLGMKDDKTAGNSTFDYDVVIKTINTVGGKVTLTIGAGVNKTLTPDALGMAKFQDIVFDKKTLTLTGTVVVGTTKPRTCTSTITVNSTLPTCSIKPVVPAAVDMAPPVGPGKGLGVIHDKASGTAGLQVDLDVDVESSVTSVNLFINGSLAGTVANSSGTSVKFTAKTLTDGKKNVIRAECTDGSNLSKSNPVEYTVDFNKPPTVSSFACTIQDNRTGKVECQWTTVTDVGTGVKDYLVKYTKDSTLTESNWSTATSGGTLKALTPGSTQKITLKDLPLGSTYSIGIKARDYAENLSPISPLATKPVGYKVETRAPVGAVKGWGGIMAAGDFDCNGFTDLAVGNPSYGSGLGQVSIYYGQKLGGLSTYPVKIFTGTIAGGNFGAGLAALNNFDMDTNGCSDLAVYASHGNTSKGRVFVYLGRKPDFFDRTDVTVGKGAELIYDLPAAAASTEMIGKKIAGIGDFDGDGATDLAVSYENTASDSAEVMIIYGDSTLTLMSTGVSPIKKVLSTDAGVRITGGKATDGFGLAIAGGGVLVKGSTYGDLLIGAKNTKVSGTAAGAAYVVKGGARATTLPETITLSGSRVVSIMGTSTNGAFGTSVAFVGDMDGDTHPEFAVGDPSVSSSTGAVYLFNLGGTTAPSTSADATATVANNVAGATGDKFGLTIGTVGDFSPSKGADFNVDAKPDLLVGSESKGTATVGAVFEIDGVSPLTGLTTSAAGYTFSAPSGATSFGKVFLVAEDFNNDGNPDLVVGDPLYNSGQGRFHVFY